MTNIKHYTIANLVKKIKTNVERILNINYLSSIAIMAFSLSSATIVEMSKIKRKNMQFGRI